MGKAQVNQKIITQIVDVEKEGDNKYIYYNINPQNGKVIINGVVAIPNEKEHIDDNNKMLNLEKTLKTQNELLVDLNDKEDKIIDLANDITKFEITKDLIKGTTSNINNDNKTIVTIRLPETKTLNQVIELSSNFIEFVSNKDFDIKLNSEFIELKFPNELIKDFIGYTLKVKIKKINSSNKNILEVLKNSINSDLEDMGLIFDIELYKVKNNSEKFLKVLNNSLILGIKPENEKIQAFDLKELGIYYLDEKLEKWTYIGGKFNPNSNILETRINYLTKIAVMKYNKEYKDINPNYWGKKYIDILTAKHIIDGMTKDTFVPSGYLTRAQLAVLVAKALKIELKDYSSYFLDISDNDWYAKYVEALARVSILNGYSNRTYKPDAKVTREEMFKIVVNAYLYKMNLKLNDFIIETTVFFNDFNETSIWAQDYVNIASNIGIIEGMPDGKLKPKKTAKRAEAAKIIYNLLNKLNEF